MARMIAILVGLTFATGCVGMIVGRVKDRATFDLSCPKEQIAVQNLDGMVAATFGATGCGKKATYLWDGEKAMLNSPIQATDASAPQTSTPTP